MRRKIERLLCGGHGLPRGRRHCLPWGAVPSGGPPRQCTRPWLAWGQRSHPAGRTPECSGGCNRQSVPRAPRCGRA
eukprot:10400354-Lingulodinium_polyedra.AAC.1